MASRTFVRALHSSRVALEAAVKPKPSAAQALGFSGEKRERVLPSLTDSAKVDISDKLMKPRGAKESKEKTNSTGGRAPKKLVQLEIPTEFFENSELAAPSGQSSQPRRPQGERRELQGQGQRGPRPGGARTGGPRRDGPRPDGVRADGARRDGQRRDGPNRGKPRGPRSGSSPQQGENRPRQAWRQQASAGAPRGSGVLLEIVARDTSRHSLFGRSSVLAPSARVSQERGSRDDAEASGIDAAAARKAEVLQRMGSYDLFVPPRPSTGKDAKANAVSKALWVTSLNPTYTLAQAKETVDAIKRCL